MKHIIRVFALVCALLVIATLNPTAQKAKPLAFGQPASLKAEVLEDWVDLKETILQLADYMPAEKYDFKPSFPLRSKGITIDTAQEDFGKRVLFIAIVNDRFLGLLGGKAKAPVLDELDESLTSKAASMKAVAESFDYGIALLNEQTDQTMLQTVDASFLGPSSRARVFGYLHSHTRQIDGQLVLYLRLSGELLSVRTVTGARTRGSRNEPPRGDGPLR